MEEIRFSRLKSGCKGVALGFEEKFLMVEKARNSWRVKLVDLQTDESLTAWHSLKNLDDLRSSLKHRDLRNLIGSQNIEKVLMTVEDNADEFDECKEPELKATEETRSSGVCNEGFFELIVNDEFNPCFLVCDKGRFTFVDSVKFNNHVFVPKTLKQIPYLPYSFYEGFLPSTEEIYSKVYDEFDAYCDVEPIWKHVLTACVLLSYQQEKLTTVPYLYLYGDNESGKTTVLNVLNELCYRPMFGVTVPSADIYGYLEDSDCIPTILEDEIQGIEKDEDKVKIYKSGYKKGACVPRTVLLEHGREIRYYHTFNFKAVAAERIPTVKGFVERFIFIPLVQGFPKKEWADNSISDLERFRDLRNMLLKWRLLTRDEPLPNLELPFKGRIKELWKPLLQSVYGLKAFQTLLDFVESQIRERMENRQNTLEGKIVKVVAELFDDKPIPFSEIWDRLLSELEGTIDTKKSYVMLTSEFDEVTKSKVGYRLREVLGGERETVRGGDTLTKAWKFDQAKLSRVLRKYGYSDLVTKLPSVPTSEGIGGIIHNNDLPKIGFISEKKEDLQEANVEKKALIPQELGTVGNSVTNQPKAVFRWRRVKPSEKCPLCGVLAVEFEISIDKDTLLRRCAACFSELRTKFSNAEWREMATLQ